MEPDEGGRPTLADERVELVVGMACGPRMGAKDEDAVLVGLRECFAGREVACLRHETEGGECAAATHELGASR